MAVTSFCPWMESLPELKWNRYQIRILLYLDAIWRRPNTGNTSDQFVVPSDLPLATGTPSLLWQSDIATLLHHSALQRHPHPRVAIPIFVCFIQEGIRNASIEFFSAISPAPFDVSFMRCSRGPGQWSHDPWQFVVGHSSRELQGAHWEAIAVGRRVDCGTSLYCVLLCCRTVGSANRSDYELSFSSVSKGNRATLKLRQAHCGTVALSRG